MSWDALKACLRGTFIEEIAAIKHNSSDLLDRVEDQVRQLELAYVLDPSEPAREAWTSGQDSLDRLRSSVAERKRFFTQQAYYEEGEKTGRLLARIARSQQASPAIGAIRDTQGRLVNEPELILAELANFYSELYKARDDFTDAELQCYIDTVALPVLSSAARAERVLCRVNLPQRIFVGYT